MTVNQRVLGSSPRGGAQALQRCRAFLLTARGRLNFIASVGTTRFYDCLKNNQSPFLLHQLSLKMNPKSFCMLKALNWSKSTKNIVLDSFQTVMRQLI